MGGRRPPGREAVADATRRVAEAGADRPKGRRRRRRAHARVHSATTALLPGRSGTVRGRHVACLRHAPRDDNKGECNAAEVPFVASLLGVACAQAKRRETGKLRFPLSNGVPSDGPKGRSEGT